MSDPCSKIASTRSDSLRSTDADCGHAALIDSLKAELEVQAALIREQAISLAHSRKIFQRASEAARIGVWECDLKDESLVWTDVVYDIFDLPRGSPLDRKQILTCYTRQSRQKLEQLRTRAIEERGGFNLDAEITTATGRHRWVRITATVESEDGRPVRIFGMKQDITEEKILWERTRYLAEFDPMTGLANRSQFQARVADLENQADPNSIGALLLIDLDGFKDVNDTFGHAFGDECLKNAALRLQNACRMADLVARVGGDEFAVLLGPLHDPGLIEGLAGEIIAAMSTSVECDGQSVKLGASVGIAYADGPASELFAQADCALYAAKAAGRSTFRTYNVDVAGVAVQRHSERAPHDVRRRTRRGPGTDERPGASLERREEPGDIQIMKSC